MGDDDDFQIGMPIRPPGLSGQMLRMAVMEFSNILQVEAMQEAAEAAKQGKPAANAADGGAQMVPVQFA